MSGFFMLAGTIETDLSLQQWRSLLQQGGIDGRLDDEEDELELEAAAANIVLRGGFGHELIAVGDAQSEDQLRSAAGQLTALLQNNALAYEFELYDRNNELIEVLKSPA
jgi:hypothetical protein